MDMGKYVMSLGKSTFLDRVVLPLLWVEKFDSISSKVDLISCTRKFFKKSFGLGQTFCILSSFHLSIPHLMASEEP